MSKSITPLIFDELDLLWQKHEKQTQFWVSSLPRIDHIEEPAFCGAWSILTTVTHRRWVLSSITERVENMRFTPSELARVYLGIKYAGRRKRMRKEQLELAKSAYPAPLFAKRGRWGQCSYIDVKSAYFNIMSIVGWDADYCPNGWLKLGIPPTDFPWQSNKLARNCLVSLALPSKILFWTGKGHVIKRGYNDHLNLGLYRLVLDVLNGVAFDMVRAGAIYAHTDGFIFPDRMLPQAKEVIETWGLSWSIKGQGETAIYSTGSYQVGELKTKHKHTASSTVSNLEISKDLVDWLRPRIFKAKQFRDR